MNKKKLTAGILVLTMGILQADLFDNEAQLDVRYGRPAQASGDSRLYRWGGIYVAVQLKDMGQGFKVSVSEAYKREDCGHLTASDIEMCLPSRTRGGKWMKRTDTAWQLGNKPIVANLQEDGKLILVRFVK